MLIFSIRGVQVPIVRVPAAIAPRFCFGHFVAVCSACFRTPERSLFVFLSIFLFVWRNFGQQKNSGRWDVMSSAFHSAYITSSLMIGRCVAIRLDHRHFHTTHSVGLELCTPYDRFYSAEQSTPRTTSGFSHRPFSNDFPFYFVFGCFWPSLTYA